MNVIVVPRHPRPAVIRVVMTRRGSGRATGHLTRAPDRIGTHGGSPTTRTAELIGSISHKTSGTIGATLGPLEDRPMRVKVKDSGSGNRPPGQGRYAPPPNQGPPPPGPNQGQDRPPPPPGNRPRGLVGCYVCGYLGCHSHFHADDERHETFTGRCYVCNQPGCRASRHQRPSGEQGYANPQHPQSSENESRGPRQGDRASQQNYSSPSSRCASA